MTSVYAFTYAELQTALVEATERAAQVEASIARVRELHICPHPEASHSQAKSCHECWHTWPCPTIRALEGGQ